jgi:hypothetical protein
MKVVDSLAMRDILGAIPVLSIVSLLLKGFPPRTGDIMYFSIVETIAAALFQIDLFIIPSGIPFPYSISNRTLSRLVLWGVVLRSVHDGPVQEGLISAETL